MPVSSTTTIKAIATKVEYENSTVASATYTIVSLDHAGTEADPYTVADARVAIDAGTGITGVYAKGIVSEIVTAYSSQYSNISYNIIDEGGSDVLQVFRGRCNDEDIIRAGDIVVVSGDLTKYNSNYQFAARSTLTSLKLVAPTFSPAAGEVTSGTEVTISDLHTGADIYYTTNGTEPTSSSTLYTAPVSITSVTTLKAIAVKDGYTTSNVSTAAYTINVTPTVTVGSNSIEAPAAGVDGTITVTYDNITTVVADVAFYESDGITPANYGWIEAEINNDNNLDYVIDANDNAEARTAYLKVYALDNESNEVYSELITFTQAGYVVDYATLPFTFDNGKNSISSTTGLTENGLGNDYGSSPYLKFDNTGDYLILKINETPGILSFDIKGNSFSGGTFKVQTSADGSSYSDLASYTTLSNTQSKEIDNLASTVRYIKWVYTNKSNGNVALGNISLKKPDTTPAITLSTNSIEATSAETDGTITVTYKNISTIESEVYFCDSEGTSATYTWIDAEIDNENNVYYTIEANTGAARTAYLKVYALDDEANDVYSELVTITQAEYVAPVPTTTWVKADLASLTANDVFLIVGNNGSDYAMTNNNGTSNPPAAVSVTVSNNTITAAIPDNLQWTISGNAEDGYTFYVNGSDSWLYCTNTNNGVRVGSNSNNTFVIEDGYLKNNATSRYVGIYNSSDWRCYTSTTGNIENETFSFYKKAAPEGAPATINLTGTLNDGLYWATFYNGTAQYALPEGALAFTMNSDKELYRLGTDGKLIPANTAVVIISDSAAITLTLKNAGKASVNGSTNILVGSNEAVTVSGISGTPYVLGVVGGKLGFYKYTGSSIPATKAYYIVNE
ncbi:MAG: chitobiase/beta-hexosaminidase C-terminal domain-containing protein [Bacteroidales bacterium]|nr:chitobiase/beta-hexosaminidase C-terminal domain-containing protein [Bacteroidales bacterium]